MYNYSYVLSDDDDNVIISNYKGNFMPISCKDNWLVIIPESVKNDPNIITTKVLYSTEENIA